jgi:hypothetical protein
MPDTPPSGPGVPRSPREPNLAVLSSKAAIVLDKKAHRIDAPLDSVLQLASMLRNRLQVPGSANAVKLLDPLTTDLLSRTFVGESRSLPELSKRAVEIVEALSKVGAETPPNKLKELRDFCVALSRSAQARSVATSDAFSTHPFRR